MDKSQIPNSNLAVGVWNLIIDLLIRLLVACASGEFLLEDHSKTKRIQLGSFAFREQLIEVIVEEKVGVAETQL